MIRWIDASVHASKNFVADCVSLLARAFQEYPEYIHLVPAPRKRPAALKAYFNVMVKFTLRNGIVLVTSGGVKGVLLYLPHPVAIDGPGMVRAGALGMALKVGKRFMAEQQKIIDAIIATRDKDGDKERMGHHGYLWFMGVEPEYQGQGIGNDLLRELASYLDGRAEDCYLETVDAQNVTYYSKRGFDLVHESEIPSTPLVFRAMVRKPGGKKA